MIETRKLTKRFGELVAVNEIDLNLAEGDVFGFIGPNGSGKTTTMRMIATLLNPDYGEAYVCGKSIYTHAEEIRRLVGYMPDFFGVYDDMTVIEYLEFFAAAYRINGRVRRRICEEKLELVDMTFKRDAMVNQLSRGQTQRIGLARTLLHEPQVLLLDEPASGLDPRARIEIRQLLRRLGETSKTIIVSSHILPELADVCTRVGMIEKGELIVDGYVDEVMRKARQRILLQIRVKEDPDGAAALIEQHDAVERVEIAGTQRPEVRGQESGVRGQESGGDRGSKIEHGDTASAGNARPSSLIPDPSSGLTPAGSNSPLTTHHSPLTSAAPRPSTNRPTIQVTLKEEIDDYSFLPTLLHEAGYKLTLFREEEVNLETAFMELTRGRQQ